MHMKSTTIAWLIALIAPTTIFAQYSGTDTNNIIERNPQRTAAESKSATKSIQTETSTSKPALLENENPKTLKVTTPRTLHPIQKEAMTFLFTNNSNVLVNLIGKGLQTELKPTFGEVGKSDITAKPTTIGYQYHFRDRWTMGVLYSWATVKSAKLKYPDFDRIGEYAEFQYVVKLNSFLASINYNWKIKNKPKSSIAWYSGLALGNSRIEYTTVRTDTSTSYIPAFNGGIDLGGFQVTAIGVKQHFYDLRNFGYHAELGGGINSIGLSFGLTYTL